MQYRLLGTFAVLRDDGTPVAIPAPKRRELLAILLLQRGRPIERGLLIDALWGDAAPDAAAESLFAHVSRLRGDLGEGVILTVPGGYQLPIADSEVDVVAFEREAMVGRAAARAGDWPRAAAVLRGALERWRGPALADVAGEAFARPEIARLEELRLECLENRIEAELNLGRHADVVPELEALIETHPLRERPWGQLMVALYGSARQADALARYRELRRTLRDELGIDPSPSLQELQLRILRQDPSLRGPVLGATSGAVGLPASASSIVGRRREQDVAIQLLGEHRVVTLTGPGGIGKSRLAVVVAQAMLEQNPDGTQFIDLSLVTDADRVLERIGEVVGGGSEPADVIGRRRMLLVLDNFEQVLDAAPAVSRLVARCPNLRLIVTSRAPLRIAGERQLEVQPLTAPDAIALFLDRASLEPTSAFPSELVARIVDRLDGLPLAVELAAARTKALALSAIRDHLEHRLGFLTSGARDAPDRHRTLRETIEWSYRLLTPEAQGAFRDLSVLAPGFDLEAGLAVGRTSVDIIASLVEHSLLRRVDQRYSMLETIREFAKAVASEEDLSAARTRLLAHYRTLPLLARRAAVGQDRDDPDLFPTGRSDDGDPTLVGGQRQDRWLDLCATDQDNLREAFAWAEASNDGEAMIDLFLGVGPYWTTFGIPEDAARWGERAIVAATSLQPDRLTETRLVAIELAKFSSDHERALVLLAEAVSDGTRRGDWRRITDGLDDMAWSYAALDRFDDAMRSLERSRETLDAIHGLPARERAHYFGTSTEVLLRAERFEEADETCRRFVDLVAELPGWVLWSTEAMLLKGLVDVGLGRADAARAGLREVVRRAAPAGLRYPLAHALDGIAALEADTNPEWSARIIGMADGSRAASRLPSFYPRQRTRTLDTLRAALGADRCADLRAAGREIPPDRLIEGPVL